MALHDQSQKCSFMALLLVTAVFLVAYVFISQNMKSNRMKVQENMNRNVSKFTWNACHSNTTAILKDNITTILIWGNWNLPNMSVGYGWKNFKERCHMDTCQLTNDALMFKSADAVVFHVKDMVLYEFPSHEGIQRMSQDRNYPIRSHPNQIFVMHHAESPTWPRQLSPFVYKLRKLNDVFNLTNTYLLDPQTDMLIHRGVWKRKLILNESALLDLVKGKSKMAAWTVSNCKAPSTRNEYVAALQKLIQVDVYGKCGKPCKEDCFSRIEKDYKFYLAFENSFCVDYITEKMYRTLGTYVVPIALNGADNAKFLPPHSYIDVRDFRSPAHLARYMKELDANHTKYMEYFKWKHDYVPPRKGTNNWCDLCKILNNKTYPYKSNFDPVKYWNPETYCKQGKEEKQLVGLL